MSAAVLDLPADLSKHEFSIVCEGLEHVCDRPAAVMTKGCSDSHHRALCGVHQARLERDFDDCKPAVCSICFRPFIHFETHFDVQDI